MKRITTTKEIKTFDDSGVVFSGNEKASYKVPFELADFSNDDLITLRAALEITGELTPALEEISIPDADGIIIIDFSLNDRVNLFPNPDIRAYIVEAIDDEEELTEIVGFVPVITKVDGVITNLKASYIAGNVLVLLTNN